MRTDLSVHRPAPLTTDGGEMLSQAAAEAKPYPLVTHVDADRIDPESVPAVSSDASKTGEPVLCDDETLPVLLHRVAQYLASKQQSANWDDVRKLLFYQSGDTAEDIRLNLAPSYYRTLHAEESE